MPNPKDKAQRTPQISEFQLRRMFGLPAVPGFVTTIAVALIDVQPEPELPAAEHVDADPVGAL